MMDECSDVAGIHRQRWWSFYGRIRLRVGSGLTHEPADARAVVRTIRRPGSVTVSPVGWGRSGPAPTGPELPAPSRPVTAAIDPVGGVPEAWVPPPAVRELREEVRYRHKLSRMRAGLKAQVDQVLGKEGVIPELKGIWWSGGQRWLDGLVLADAYTNRIGSLQDLIALHDREVAQSDARIHRRLKGHRGYEAIQQIAGVGHVLAAVFVAEIGDVHRFGDARHLCSWAGLTPRLGESDAHSHRGHITKQGSRAAALGRGRSGLRCRP